MHLSLEAFEKILTMNGFRQITIETVCDNQWHFWTVNKIIYSIGVQPCMVKMIPSVHKRVALKICLWGNAWVLEVQLTL